jgi:hypothetical protein
LTLSAAVIGLLPLGRPVCQPPPSSATAAARAGGIVGEAVELLDQIADQFEPEDGCLWLYDSNERATLGFTMRGIDSLKELIADQKR